MIRFSASEEEIGALVRFLKRRAPGNRLFLAPLHPESRDRRLRRTARPLLSALASDNKSTRWGLFTSLDAAPTATRADEDACLMLLQLGPEDNEGRREALLEARDEMAPDRHTLTHRSEVARTLVEKCARRLRRRGNREKGRWVIS